MSKVPGEEGCRGEGDGLLSIIKYRLCTNIPGKEYVFKLASRGHSDQAKGLPSHAVSAKRVYFPKMKKTDEFYPLYLLPLPPPHQTQISCQDFTSFTYPLLLLLGRKEFILMYLYKFN